MGHSELLAVKSSLVRHSTSAESGSPRARVAANCPHGLLSTLQMGQQESGLCDEFAFIQNRLMLRIMQRHLAPTMSHCGLQQSSAPLATNRPSWHRLDSRMPGKTMAQTCSQLLSAKRPCDGARMLGLEAPCPARTASPKLILPGPNGPALKPLPTRSFHRSARFSPNADSWRRHRA